MLEISFSSPSIIARRSSCPISDFGDLNELRGKTAEVSEDRQEDDEGREREEREISTSIRSSGSLSSSLPLSFSDVSSALSHEQTLLTTNSSPRPNSSSREIREEEGEEIEGKGEREGSCDRIRSRVLGSNIRNNNRYDNNNNMVNTTNHNSTTSSTSSIGGSYHSECSTSENSGNSKSIRLNGGIRKNDGAAVGGSGGSSVTLTSYLDSFYAQCREREANDRDNCVAALRSLSHWNGTQWTVESEWHRSRRMEEKVRTYQEKYLYFGLPNDKVNNSNEGWRKGSNGWWRMGRGGRRGENSTSRSQSFHLPYHQKLSFHPSRSMPYEKKKEEERTWICGTHFNNSEASGVSNILLSTHETSSSSSSSNSDTTSFLFSTSRMGEKREDEECQAEEMGVSETTNRSLMAKSLQLLDERQPKEEKACEYDGWGVARPVLSSMRRDEEMIEKEGSNRSGLKEVKERCEAAEEWNEEEETEVQEMEEGEEKIEEMKERKEENKIERDEKQKKQEVKEINRNEIFDGNSEKVVDAAEKKREDEKEQIDDDVVKREEFRYSPNHSNYLLSPYLPSMRGSDVSTKSSSTSSNSSTTCNTSSDGSETSSLNSSTTCNTSSDGSEITDSDDSSERILLRTTNSSVNSPPDYSLNEQMKRLKLSKNDENVFSFPDIFVTQTDEMRVSSCSPEEMPGDCSQHIGTLPSSSSSSSVSSSLSYLLSSASLINLSSLLTSSSSTFPNLINLHLDLSPPIIPEMPSNFFGEAPFMRRNAEGEEEEGGSEDASSFISLRNEEVERGESYRGEKRVKNEGLEGRTEGSSNNRSRGSSEGDGRLISGEMKQHEENGRESHSNIYSKSNIDFWKSERVGQQNEEEEQEWRRTMNVSSDNSSGRERGSRSTSTITSSSKMVYNAQYLLGPWTSILANNSPGIDEKQN